MSKLTEDSLLRYNTEKPKKELIKEFLNDLENKVLCWEGTQTERNVVKIIKKWKERLKNGS